MRVYIEQTPQKNILKFICDEIITSGNLEFDVQSDKTTSPLAEQLFQFPFVEKIYITANFVALQKSDFVEWEDIAQELKVIVNEHLEKGGIVAHEKKKIAYSLYAEMTPNPHVMKFVSNQILTGAMVEVKKLEYAEKVPVAEALYRNFAYVKEVFLSENYISVTADEQTDWQMYAIEVRQFLLNYLQSGKTLVADDYVPVKSEVEKELEQKTYTGTEQKIQQLLNEYIQPAVANDGGNIALLSFDESSKTAQMLLQGACSGCPSSTMTLKNGIENLLKEMMPGEVDNVVAING